MEILFAVLKLAGCVLAALISFVAYLFLVCKLVDK